MQPDIITLAAGTAEEIVFKRYSEYDSRTVYIAPDHSVAMKDILTLYRTEPKAVTNYFGAAKSAMKFSKDFTVALPTGGNGRAPLIVELSLSVPVGVTKTEALSMAQRVTSLLAADDVAADLISKLEI